MGNDAETKRSGNLQLPVKRSIWMVQEFYAMRAKKGLDHEKKISSSTSSGQVSCSSSGALIMLVMPYQSANQNLFFKRGN